MGCSPANFDPAARCWSHTQNMTVKWDHHLKDGEEHMFETSQEFWGLYIYA